VDGRPPWGDAPLTIKRVLGHTTFATTEIYIREADAIREGFGDVFPTLPACLLGAAGGGQSYASGKTALAGLAENKLF
jgi:hypothetical protein